MRQGAKRSIALANPELVREGDQTGGDMEGIEIGEMEVNMEKDPWDGWTHEEYGDGEFDLRLIREARTEEVQYMENTKVWQPASWEEGLQNIGRSPITAKWVDVDKGRGGEVQTGSRLVAICFKVKNDGRGFDVFAAPPPWEMKRLLFGMSRVHECVGGGKKEGPVKLMFIGVKKAHLKRRGRGERVRVHRAAERGRRRDRQVEEVVVRNAAGSICVGGSLRGEVEQDRVRQGPGITDCIRQSGGRRGCESSCVGGGGGATLRSLGGSVG